VAVVCVISSLEHLFIGTSPPPALVFASFHQLNIGALQPNWQSDDMVIEMMFGEINICNFKCDSGCTEDHKCLKIRDNPPGESKNYILVDRPSSTTRQRMEVIINHDDAVHALHYFTQGTLEKEGSPSPGLMPVIMPRTLSM